jgi:hypothetical protein
MKQTITESGFHQAFHNAGRADQFSRAARSALFEYLEDIEAGCGEEIELDVIGICCDFSEHANAIEWAKDYFADHDSMLVGLGLEAGADDDDIEAAATDYISERGTLLAFDGGIVVSQF